MRFRINLFLALLLGALLALTAGCGRDKRPDYIESEEMAPIEVPPGLTRPDTSRALDLPGDYPAELAGARDDARPPRVLPSDEARLARSRIRTGTHGLFLEVDDEADSVFHRVGLALNRKEMELREVSAEQQSYRFQFNDSPEVEKRRGLRRLAFWRRAAVYDYSGEYQVKLEPDDRRTQVHLFNVDGSTVDMDAAEAVLEELKDRLG